MFSLVKEAHLSCLKVWFVVRFLSRARPLCMVCSGGEEAANIAPGIAQRSVAAAPEDLSELDLFMEAYYMALVELSLAIQKPLQEAAAFAGCICYLLDDVSADAPGSATANPAE
ncbi:unnamed protein product [Spirodela intermedia]|uniref:KNOX2 domain-containing protein n=2 Tax=Spirodela intermedia TaxID=51605 RepID=A0A7I8J5T9_SPIIN|nr:unnamed protein product [Spirodela intermedia]CAA6664763.1 unnamed protein product [Spirodela intermedia]CAA7401364.1 unnamed protein product [Spirodela intermedia]